MDTETNENDDVVPIQFSVIDNTEEKFKGLEKGYYFVIGDFSEQDEIEARTETVDLDVYAGPYDTEQKAIDAAIETIIDLMRVVLEEIGGENVSVDFSHYEKKD